MKSRKTKVKAELEPFTELDDLLLDQESDESIGESVESESESEGADGAADPAYSWNECFQVFPKMVRQLLFLSFENAGKFGWLRSWKTKDGDWTAVRNELKSTMAPEILAEIEKFWTDNRVKYLELLYVDIPNLAECTEALAAELSHHTLTPEWTVEVADLLISDPVRFWWLALDGGSANWSAVLEVLQHKKALELSKMPTEAQLESLWDTQGRPVIRQTLEQLGDIFPGNHAK